MAAYEPAANMPSYPPINGGIEAYLQELVGLLQAGLYERVLEGLQKIESDRLDSSNSQLATLLDIAQQICRVGQQYQNEIKAHQRHYEEAVWREERLREQLQHMLETTTSQTAVSTKPAPKLASPKKLGRIQTAPAPVVLDEEKRPLFTVYCLGSFQLYLNEKPITEWHSRKGKAIFKYLLLHRQTPIAKEVLMDIFWPDSVPDSARNNLNVAIHKLRKTLRQSESDVSYIKFENDAYQLNPELGLWVDLEQFSSHINTAKSLEADNFTEQAMKEYYAADALYQGEFLAEDRYEEWIINKRRMIVEDCLIALEKLNRFYFAQSDFTNCIHTLRKMLTIQPFREDAHRQLMRCYHQQGQTYLALRQYHLCQDALEKELEVPPSEITKTLYKKIRQRN